LSDFAAVKQQPLSQSVLVALREAIIAGRLNPGQPLIQAKLAAQFGVSRAPLREALNRLEEEGFVKTTPYKGSVVAPLTHQNVAEIRSLRAMVEEFAGQMIIAGLRPEQLAEIEAIYQRMREAAARGEADEVDTLDLALHQKICELSNHSLLIEVWNRYANQFRRVLTFTNLVNQDLRLIVDRHEPLIEAFRRRDREALRDFYLNQGTDLTAYLPVGWHEDGIWESAANGREHEPIPRAPGSDGGEDFRHP
jgi:DNA-binding GntR family transcriptional regulator